MNKKFMGEKKKDMRKKKKCQVKRRNTLFLNSLMFMMMNMTIPLINIIAYVLFIFSYFKT